jgi:ankyrin repeat protein
LYLSGCGSGKPKGGSRVDIWKAVEQEDVAGIKAYASGGGDLDVGKTVYGKTPLLYALELKKRQSYETLLSVGASPNTECRGGKVAIHWAAYEEDSFWLEAALAHEGDPNLMNHAKGMQKGTPMFYAIPGDERNTVENVKLLLDHGADINARINLRGDTALALACKVTEFEIAHLLLERGADYNETHRMAETFIYTIRDMRPEYYENDPHTAKWCKAVWDWLLAHGVDPAKAKWGGEKWILE